MKSDKSYILFINKTKLLKMYVTIESIREKYNTKVNTIFTNSKISNISDSHRQSPNLKYKINLKK